MSDVVSQFGYATAVVGGAVAICAALFATLAVARRRPGIALSARRLVRFATGVFLVGAGLNIGVLEPPITLVWGGFLVVIAGYFFSRAVAFR